MLHIVWVCTMYIYPMLELSPFSPFLGSSPVLLLDSRSLDVLFHRLGGGGWLGGSLVGWLVGPWLMVVRLIVLSNSGEPNVNFMVSVRIYGLNPIET